MDADGRVTDFFFRKNPFQRLNSKNQSGKKFAY
jgi:hypothetical protein